MLFSRIYRTRNKNMGIKLGNQDLNREANITFTLSAFL